jgi:hypothetical protein
MSMTYWSIDSTLQLQPEADLPPNVSPLDGPEQLIDTVMLRNFDLLCQDILRRPGRFLFHSTEYWGPFDVGGILSDGDLVVFENKGKSFTRAGLTKEPRKNNLMKLVLLENVIQVIVAACMMRKRSKGFGRSFWHFRQ